MTRSAMTLTQALAAPDKGTVTAIEDPTITSLSELAQFPNLTSLSLSHAKGVRDFAPLAALRLLEKLWLDDMGLSEIPAEIARLERLRLLFLGKNAIKDFSILARTPGLEDLGLEELSLKKLPDEVLSLKKLAILGLYGNALATIAPLAKLRELRELYVASNELKQIPAELEALPLTKLDVMHNYRLKSWGPLAQLRELRDLSLTNAHDLPRLPAGIFSLAKLNRLRIAIHWNAPEDPLDGLADIGKLTELETLHVTGAAMTTLPSGFGALAKLHTLDLSDSKHLADVNALAGLPALRELKLAKCEKLADVSGLRDMPALETLELTQCVIRELPSTFSSLKALRTLNVSHNKQLAAVPGLADLPALEKLTLYSQMKSFPASLGTLTALQVLQISSAGAGLEFLPSLVEVHELYVADCKFDALPPSLAKLRKLTIHRDDRGGDDASLAKFPALEELDVAKPKFVLPVLPKLRALLVRQLANDESLDLSALANMPALTELTIEVCDHMKTAPPAIASARGLQKLVFDMLDRIEDFSGIAGSPITELVLDGCEKMQKLPPSLAELPNLRTLTVKSSDALTDVEVLGSLRALRTLTLERLDEVTKLPSMAGATELESVKIERLRSLKDVSGLAKAPALKRFSAEDCKKLSASAAAAITNALAGAKADAPAPKTTYASFMKSKQYEKLAGKEDAKHTYPFPLAFGTPKQLLEVMEDFSWLDDHRDDGEGDVQAMLNGEESALVPLAVLDFGWKGCEDATIDAYAEEIFLVDTADARNPVLLWGHDGDPRKIHDSFDAFLASLRDFGRAKSDEAAGSSEEGGGGGDLASLKFVEGSSSKFWKIRLEGDSHTVTFGKIGTAGQSKTKTFPNADAAAKDANKLVAEKRGKGYVDAT